MENNDKDLILFRLRVKQRVLQMKKVAELTGEALDELISVANSRGIDTTRYEADRKAYNKASKDCYPE